MGRSGANRLEDSESGTSKQDGKFGPCQASQPLICLGPSGLNEAVCQHAIFENWANNADQHHSNHVAEFFS
jgi:hypothetical protein